MQIGSCISVPGKLVRGSLRAAKYTNTNGETTELDLSVFIMEGQNPGPKVLFLSGFKGTDTVGTYALYSFLEKIQNQTLSGTIVALPIINISGYFAGFDAHPFDGKLIEGVFPGDPNDTVSYQIANVIFNDVVPNVDTVVYFSDEDHGVASEVYAKVFGPKEIIAENDISLQKSLSYGVGLVLLEQALEGNFAIEIRQKYEIPVVKVVSGGKRSANMEYSLGELHRILKNSLISAGVLDGKLDLVDTQYVIDGFEVVFSSIAGIWESKVKLGQFVSAGELIGILLNPETGEKQDIVSNIDGKIFQLNEALRIVKDDKICTVLPILDKATQKSSKSKKQKDLSKTALKVISNK